MISKQILQSTLEGNKEIAGADFCLTDLEGTVLASTFEPDRMKLRPMVVAFTESPAENQEIQGRKFFKVMDGKRLEYILIVSSEGESGYTFGKLALFQLQSLMTAYRDRFDKDNFVKNLILDNLLLVDIHNRAQKLHIENKRRRVVFLLETDAAGYQEVLEGVRGIFASRLGDFITAVDEKSVILVKELEENEGYPELQKTAKVIMETLPTRKIGELRISFGSIVEELREVSHSYKEARMALDVGRIFYEEKRIVPYNKLGIGRLIYQLPMSLCELFTKEIFGKKMPEDFDEETLMTIHKFFEKNLNVSETSRQLYIHRNTLVYRLDKLYKMTGLDLRVFEDAITFNIALMVLKYMKHMVKTEF